MGEFTIRNKNERENYESQLNQEREQRRYEAFEQATLIEVLLAKTEEEITCLVAKKDDQIADLTDNVKRLKGEVRQMEANAVEQEQVMKSKELKTAFVKSMFTAKD